jgi:DHA1 family tetracycline resistance protein-like MFS transporter
MNILKLDKRIAFVAITMFLNFLSFSIIIPVLPFIISKFTQNLNEIAIGIGLTTSAFSLCQFFAAPVLGAFSDRFGRRPILLLSLSGSIVGFLILAIANSLPVLLLGRVIDGLTGGNISTIYAYIADITKPEDRGKYYGIIGAAGGFGFVVGPVMGGLLGNVNLSLPLYLAAFVTLLNVIWGYFILPESLHLEHRLKKIEISHMNPFAQFAHVFSIPALKRIFLVAFLFFIGLTGLHSTTSVFLKEIFNWGPVQIGILLFVVGIFDIVSQGYLVRKLLPKLGDAKVSLLGLALSIVGFVITASTTIFQYPALFYLGVIVYIIGDGLFEPSNASLISFSVPREMQGRVQGASQGMQSIARVLGPILATYLFTIWLGLPYLASAILMGISFIVLVTSLSIIHEHKESTESF